LFRERQPAPRLRVAVREADVMARRGRERDKERWRDMLLYALRERVVNRRLVVSTANQDMAGRVPRMKGARTIRRVHIRLKGRR